MGIVFIIIVALVLIYIGGNLEPIEVRFLFWHTQASKALVTLGALFAGVILGIILTKIDQRRRGKREEKEVR